LAAARLYQRKWLLIRLPIGIAAVLAMAWLWQALLPMPPTELTISSGGPDGLYHAYAKRYAAKFAERGVQLRVLESAGAEDNLRRLRRLAQPEAQLAFVQGGVITAGGTQPGARLLTIARVDIEPLWIFSRVPGLDSLQDLQGRRVSLGPDGSGTRQLATSLLAQVRLTPADLADSQLTGAAAVEALRQGKLDAVLLVMSAGAPLVRSFLQVPGVQLVQLNRSAALIERLPYLQARLLPAGTLDATARLPARDLTVLATTASLLAQADLHPALQRLTAAVAREVHEAPGLFHRPGEFPSLRRIEYPASPDARETLARGLPWLERQLPFWWAQLVLRLLVVCLPVALLAWWLARLVPAWLRWVIESRLVRWYGELKFIENDLERDLVSGLDITRHMARLKQIDQRMKAFTPPDDLMARWFTLRKHIWFVQLNLLKRRGR
jgi:TRAP transporter TAXI family solute receptor